MAAMQIPSGASASHIREGLKAEVYSKAQAVAYLQDRVNHSVSKGILPRPRFTRLLGELMGAEVTIPDGLMTRQEYKAAQAGRSGSVKAA